MYINYLTAHNSVNGIEVRIFIIFKFTFFFFSQARPGDVLEVHYEVTFDIFFTLLFLNTKIQQFKNILLTENE